MPPVHDVIPEWVVHWFVRSVAFWLTARMVPGFRVAGFGNAIIVAAIFGIVSFLLSWLLFGLIVIGTLGIALLVRFITTWFINAVLLKITSGITDRLEVRSFGTALIAALVMSVIGAIGTELLERALHHGVVGQTVYI